MKKSRRSMQVGDVVRNELSAILQREVHDPALGFMTVTGVEMSPDLRHARIFVSTLGSEEDLRKVADELQKGRARIRFLLGQRAGLRIKEVPIRFVDRERGTSKMSTRIALEATWRVWQIKRRY